MRKNRINIQLQSGKVLSIHRRDMAKDAIIIGMLPTFPQKIFDVSAGRAQLAQRLQDMGHTVSISNYEMTEDIPFSQFQLDLNTNNEDSLPQAPFDIIICREVIEHIENVPHVLRFFKKNLSRNGIVILTFPNRLTFRSRLYYLFTGFYRGMPSPINLSHYMGSEHINLIGYPEMDYFLRKTGYAIEAVKTSEISIFDYLCFVAWPFLWIATTYFILFHKKNREGHEKDSTEERNKNRFIRDILLSRSLFIGKDIIIKAHLLSEDGV